MFHLHLLPAPSDRIKQTNNKKNPTRIFRKKRKLILLGNVSVPILWNNTVLWFPFIVPFKENPFLRVFARVVLQ